MQRDFSSTDRNFNEYKVCFEIKQFRVGIKEELSSSFFSNDPMNNLEALNHQIPDFDPKKPVFKPEEFENSPGKEISECSMTYSASNPTRTNTMSQRANSNNMRLARKNSQGNSKSIDVLRLKEFKSDDGFNISDVNDSQFQNLDSRRESPGATLDIAKNNIRRFEEEMKNISEKHETLVHEVETNYRQLERETEQYYNEILEKWKDIIKEKVFKYKQQYESIIQELEMKNNALLEERENTFKKCQDEFDDQKNKIINDLAIEFQDRLERADQEKETLIEEIEKYKICIQNLEIQAQKDVDDLEEYNGKLHEKNKELEKALYTEITNKNQDEVGFCLEMIINQVDINLTNEAYQSRMSSHENTIKELNELQSSLKSENLDLKAKIDQMNKEFEERCKSYEDKIHNLKVMMKLERPKENHLTENSNSNNCNEKNQDIKEKSISEERGRFDPNVMQNYLKKLEEAIEMKLDWKKKINGWLESFKKKEGRMPEQSDKLAIKGWYEKYNEAKKLIKENEDMIMNIDTSNKENSTIMSNVIENRTQHPKSMSPRRSKMARNFLTSSQNIVNTSINGSFDANVSHINISHLNTSHTDQSLLQNNSFFHSSGLPMGGTNENIKSIQLRSSLNISKIEENEELQKFKAEISRLQLDLQKMQADNTKLLQEKTQLKEKILSLKRNKSHNSENSIINDESERKSVDLDRSKLGLNEDGKYKDLENRAKKNEEDHKKQIREIVAAKDSIIDKLESEIKTLVSQQEKQSREIKSYSNEFAKLLNEKNSMERDLEQLEKHKQSLELNIKNEISQRKKLHNIIQDMKGKIRVFCRIRPLLNWEVERGFDTVINHDDFNVTVETKNGPKVFSYDSIFGPVSNQDQVFEDTRRLIQSAVDGYNVCIFAYGQTGSGKTYTMHGSPENPGITPRSVEEIFNHVSQMEASCDITISCNMVELYMDTLIDLLAPKGKKNQHLEIKEDIKGMVYIQNVTNHIVSTKEQLNKLIKNGMNNRKTSSTSMNEDSSRSHLVVNITIEVYNKHTDQKTMGKLSLVDLAGSERINKSNPTQKQMNETRSINRSLTALADVISALTDNNVDGNRFIPYRNNKLTMLMKDCLGGTAKSLMLVNINPADYNAEETQGSLYYAHRVKMIVNECVKNIETREVSKIKEQLRLISDERDSMRNILVKNGIQYNYKNYIEMSYTTPTKSDDDDDKYDEGPIYSNFEKMKV